MAWVEGEVKNRYDDYLQPLVKVFVLICSMLLNLHQFSASFFSFVDGQSEDKCCLAGRGERELMEAERNLRAKAFRNNAINFKLKQRFQVLPVCPR